VDDGQVVVLPLMPTPPYRMIGMVWRRQSARREEYVALADLIRDILRRDVPEVTVMT